MTGPSSRHAPRAVRSSGIETTLADRTQTVPAALAARRLRSAALGLFLFIAFGTQAALAQHAQRELPDFDVVQKIVAEHFAAKKDHRETDLISRGEVEPLFPKLEAAGWNVADQKEIEAAVLGDSHVLVKKLRTPAGRKFMRQVARDPEGFDRLDRLARLPRGERMLEDLIDGPDGYKLIDYMTRTEGGRELGRQLSNAPRGRNFNKETGRLYTQKMLIERLKASYDEAQKPPR